MISKSLLVLERATSGGVAPPLPSMYLFLMSEPLQPPLKPYSLFRALLVGAHVGLKVRKDVSSDDVSVTDTKQKIVACILQKIVTTSRQIV